MSLKKEVLTKTRWEGLAQNVNEVLEERLALKEIEWGLLSACSK